MICKAGTDVMTSIPCDGKRELFIHIGGPGQKVKWYAWNIGDTQGTGGTYIQPDGQGTIDADRPGPIGLPEGVRVVSLMTTASKDFTAWCA